MVVLRSALGLRFDITSWASSVQVGWWDVAYCTPIILPSWAAVSFTDAWVCLVEDIFMILPAGDIRVTSR
jgi:hypothetical protein